MYKRMTSLVLALVMCLSLCVVGASAANKHYTVDFNDWSDKEWADSAVWVSFHFNGTSDAITLRPQDVDGLGHPVLLDLLKDEKTGAGMTVTYAPLRAICNALGVQVDWVNAADGEPGYAVINANGKEMKLYEGATSISDGETVYEENTYRFPPLEGQTEGDPIPLCLNRKGRLYLPVRFFSTFFMEGEPQFNWSSNGYALDILGNSKLVTSPDRPVGINTNLVKIHKDEADVQWKSMPTLMETLKNKDYKDYNGWLQVKSRDTKYVIDAEETLLIGGASYNGKAAIVVEGVEENDDDGTQWQVIDAFLKDAVCDADRTEIMKILNEKAEKMNDGRGATFTDEARAWRNNNWENSHVLSEVEFTWIDQYMRKFVITNK